MTLGALIERLERIEAREGGAGLPVYFDFARFRPSGVLESYRGYYTDLALGYTEELDEYFPLGVILSRLRAAIGQTFQGWKGGDYLMGARTRMWASNPGEASGSEIVGIRDDEWRVVLVTEQEE